MTSKRKQFRYTKTAQLMRAQRSQIYRVFLQHSYEVFLYHIPHGAHKFTSYSIQYIPYRSLSKRKLFSQVAFTLFAHIKFIFKQVIKPKIGTLLLIGKDILSKYVFRRFEPFVAKSSVKCAKIKSATIYALNLF
jgi:hypothetical protein